MPPAERPLLGNNHTGQSPDGDTPREGETPREGGNDRTPRGIGGYFNMFREGYDEVRLFPPKLLQQHFLPIPQFC